MLTIRRRQRTPRNLTAQRAAGVLLEQLGQLLAHAVRHRSLDWLRCSAEATIKHLFDRSDTHSLALGAGGEPYQLLDQGRCFMAANLLQFARHNVGRALLATTRFR